MTASPQEFLDISIFTNPHTRFDLVRKAIWNSMQWDVWKNKTEWKAKVLSPPIKLTDGDSGGLDGTGRRPPGNAAGSAQAQADRLSDASGMPTSSTKFWFKARLLGNPSPHDYITDPCRADVAQDGDRAYRLIGLHTTFISGDDSSSEAVATPKVGDIVNVTLTPNQFSYDLAFGRFNSVATNSPAGTPPPGPLISAESLEREKQMSQGTQEMRQQVRAEMIAEAASEPDPEPDCTRLQSLFADFDPAIFAPPGAAAAAGGPMPTAGTITPDNIIPDPIAHAQSLGYETWVTPYRMWFFGIRNGVRGSEEDAFDDIIGCIYYDEAGVRHDIYWPGTVDPGNYFRLDPIGNNTGTAFMKAGQYIDAWKRRNHGKDNPYPAYGQKGAITLHRDSILDIQADIPPWVSEEQVYTYDTSGAGINLHRADVSGRSTKVVNWSAGCQVVTGEGSWEQFLQLGNEQMARYDTPLGNSENDARFSYTLFNKWFQ